MNLQPINWKTKIPLVVDDNGNLFYFTHKMKNKTYCDVAKNGLPYNWDLIDEKIEKKYLEDRGIPFELIIVQASDEISEYDTIGESYHKHSSVSLPEKYDNIIDQQYIIKMNDNLVKPFCKNHKQRHSKKQCSKSRYFERKHKTLDIERYKNADLLSFDIDNNSENNIMIDEECDERDERNERNERNELLNCECYECTGEYFSPYNCMCDEKICDWATKCEFCGMVFCYMGGPCCMR
ncbi:hypothetical protein Klosneuvirus_1_98 [Klosneuvirus KNV1]|uniref:Uncharacterized protein n=1 Tax=Klosneuvirus KNV1 TaxID=1977640 RepID=A0A1V0SHV0_9VIRU|nr:hypothetical protein Klosneuvirus_1_98 [Klosneuvirus KNV1]